MLGSARSRDWPDHARRKGTDVQPVHLHDHESRLKPGAYEAERHRVPGLVEETIRAGEPRLLAGFNQYINAERTEVTVVQVHPDAASMEFHMGVVRERAAQAYSETLDATTQIQVFGTPSDAVVDTLRAQAGAGVPLSVHPEHLGGFARIGGHTPRRRGLNGPGSPPSFRTGASRVVWARDL